MAHRLIACLVALGLCALGARQASAAAEVHRLNLVLSSNPTSISSGDVNEQIQDFNRIRLAPRGLEDVETIGFGWLYQAELRYFVRPNVAASFGVGHLRSISRREFLPRISQRINLRAEIISVPLHAGATYYLAPYNQGDFQARAYLGGGFMSVTNNKFVFESLESQTDTSTTLGGSFRTRARRDAPGYYLEAGAHMFFAVRYSVMLGAIYRSAVIRDMIVTQEIIDEETGAVTRLPGTPIDMDVGGLGARMAVAIGF
jgi:hypothetical protein